MNWTSELVAATLGVTVDDLIEFSHVTTDTRSLEKGALFVALRGDRFDGHEFVRDAVAAGARGCVVERGSTAPIAGVSLFEVDDTRRALGLLARARRRQFEGPVIAITGSNGKTTTKELVAAALSPQYSVHKTAKNENNLVGVPLTLLGTPSDATAVVVEVGANQLGEIPRLREVVEPDVAVVINVSAAHVEGFGDLEAITKEKLSLLRHARQAFVGDEPVSLPADAAEYANSVQTVSLQQLVGEPVVSAEGKTRFDYSGVEFEVPLVGVHNAYNALFAIRIAEGLGVPLTKVATALTAVVVPEGRSQIVRRGDLIILNDTYNSSPNSALKALDTVVRMRGRRRVAVVLGTMLELGAESDRLHQEVLASAIMLDPDVLVLQGEFAHAAAGLEFGGSLILAEDAKEIGPRLGVELNGDELVLLKASRGVGLEVVLDSLGDAQ